MPLLVAALVLLILAISQVATMPGLGNDGNADATVDVAGSVRAEQARDRAAQRQVSRDTRRGGPVAAPQAPTAPPVEHVPVDESQTAAPEESSTDTTSTDTTSTDTTSTDTTSTDTDSTGPTTTGPTTTGPTTTGPTTTRPTPGTASAQQSPATGARSPAGQPPASAATPPAGEHPGSTSVAPATSGPAAGRAVAFADEFDTLDLGPGRRWGHKTTSYEFGDHNPDNYKRDWVTPEAMQVSGGVLTMTATRRDDFYWNTGLLTTQDFHGTGGDGFRVQAGDFLVNRVMLPTGNTGAWPGLWTWDGPDGEIDVFEWHSDVPHILEFTNHVRDGGEYHEDDNLIAPGRWVWIGVQLGSDDNTWYVGDTLEGMQPVFSDGTGIGEMRPFIIANLSVNVSPWHPSPSGSEPIVYKIDTVRVYR